MSRNGKTGGEANKEETKKTIEQQIRDDRSFDGHFNMIDWLYSNGYQIVKLKVTTESIGTLEINPKSKFMEDARSVLDWLDGQDKYINKDRTIHAIGELMRLIDKHKADK